LFVDDLKIYKEIVIQQNTEELKADVRALEQWTRENYFPLNVKKCKAVTHTRKRSPINAKYSIQGEELSREGDIRDLGILMEGKLNYTKQFRKVVTTAKRRVRRMRWVRGWLE